MGCGMSNPSRSSDAPLPEGGRLLVVGDIHGELDLLDYLLSSIRFDGRHDVLLCVGDLIDRGPRSFDTLRAFVGPTRRPGFRSLMGNHEALLLARMHPGSSSYRPWGRPNNPAGLHRGNGGLWAEGHLEAVSALYPDLEQLPLCARYQARDGRQVGIVHGELSVGRTWSDLEAATPVYADYVDGAESLACGALWGRDRAGWAGAVLAGEIDAAEHATLDAWRYVHGVDLVFTGHSITTTFEPVRWGNQLWIDTGAYQHRDGGRLTIVDVDQSGFWQATYDAQGYPVVMDARPLPEPLT